MWHSMPGACCSKKPLSGDNGGAQDILDNLKSGTHNNKRRRHSSLASSAGPRGECSAHPAVFSSAHSGQGLIPDPTPSLKHSCKSRHSQQSQMTHSSDSMPQPPAATQEAGNQVTFTTSPTHPQPTSALQPGLSRNCKRNSNISRDN